MAKTFLPVIILIFTACTGSLFKTKTEYAKNQETDRDRAIDSDAFRRAIGDEKYAVLQSAIPRCQLDLLVYGMRQSNAIQLINNIADVTRISAILNAPDAVAPLTW